MRVGSLHTGYLLLEKQPGRVGRQTRQAGPAAGGRQGRGIVDSIRMVSNIYKNSNLRMGTHTRQAGQVVEERVGLAGWFGWLAAWLPGWLADRLVAKVAHSLFPLQCLCMNISKSCYVFISDANVAINTRRSW